MRKILIICEENDPSVLEVIEWLIFYKQEVIVLTEYTYIENLVIFIENGFLEVEFSVFCELNKEKQFFKLSEIKSYFYRRGKLIFEEKISAYIERINFLDRSILNMMINQELKDIEDYIHYSLSKIKHINSFFDLNINKLIVLNIAVECNLKIPKTIIVKNKVYLNKKNNYITKAIRDGIYNIGDGSVIKDGTYRVNKLPEKFFYSKIQLEIRKKYEVRVFYLDGLFISGAILSQFNSKTKIDYRDYENHEDQPRIVKYNLPESLKLKIDDLMRKLEINCGSIDFIVDNDNEFYFLEVNPVGQFRQLSKYCNVSIEKLIAEFLL